jgi:phage shock protein PspC (stress-responsive transcriptional regulator)
MRYQPEYSVNKVFTKDIVHKKVSGVCGGIARYYDLPRWLVRTGAVVSLIALPMVTGVAYLVATLLLPNR